jgi:hypothetical protein
VPEEGKDGRIKEQDAQQSKEGQAVNQEEKEVKGEVKDEVKGKVEAEEAKLLGFLFFSS